MPQTHSEVKNRNIRFKFSNFIIAKIIFNFKKVQSGINQSIFFGVILPQVNLVLYLYISLQEGRNVLILDKKFSMSLMIVVMLKLIDMRNIMLFFLMMVCAGAMGQTNKPTPQPVKVKADTVIKLGGRKFPAYIKQVQSNFVVYALVSKPDSTITTPRKELEKIIFKDGRKEEFSKPAVQMVEEGQWEAVLVTRKEKDVQGLYKRGFVSGKSTGSARSKKAAQESATKRLQKSTAAKGGSIVLITNEENQGAYGDIPVIYIEGEAYGPTPLEKGTNVVEDKAKKAPVKK